MNPLAFVLRTYRQIRRVAGWTLIAVPLLILAVAYCLEPEIKPTLSHYYWVEPKPGLVRTLFTGFLLFVGGIMMAYRGFDGRDNWIHNGAGACAVCVAFFPKLCDDVDPYCSPGLLSVLHMPAAVFLYAFAAYAVYYYGGPKLQDRLKDKEIETVQRARMWSLITMSTAIVLYLMSPFLIPILRPILRPILDFSITILFVELLGFFAFAGHWLVMTSVIDKANQRIRQEHEDFKLREAALATSLGFTAGQPEQKRVVDVDEASLLEIP